MSNLVVFSTTKIDAIACAEPHAWFLHAHALTLIQIGCKHNARHKHGWVVNLGDFASMRHKENKGHWPSQNDPINNKAQMLFLNIMGMLDPEAALTSKNLLRQLHNASAIVWSTMVTRCPIVKMMLSQTTVLARGDMGSQEFTICIESNTFLCSNFLELAKCKIKLLDTDCR